MSNSQGRAGTSPTEVDVAIIGGGLGGLCAAAKLKEEGIERFVILDKADGVGGVWRTNRYPNVACDTPIDIYGISYFPGTKWSHNFAPGSEIGAYLGEFVDTFGLSSSIELRTEISEASWDEERASWTLQASDGRSWVSRYLIWAGGLFSRPSIPKVPGLESFKGEMLHSTQWRDDVVLDGKRVAVVGGGATAIQIMPYAAQRASKVVNFVRTPSYVMPRPDIAFTAEDRQSPAFAAGLRDRREQWFQIFEKIAEARFPMNSDVIGQQETVWRQYFDTVVHDPHLREVLAPDYRFGCKRPLFSNEYYPAMNRDNVEVVGKGVARVESDAIVDKDGKSYPVDIIVWATGFDTENMLGGLHLVGRGGRSLQQAWQAAPEAYYGTLVAGFPNLFLMNGPNAGGASATVFIEGQAELIARALDTARRSGAEVVDVPDETHLAYNDDVQRKTDQSVMVLGNCISYYRIGGNGRVFTHWPGTIAAFHEAIRNDAFGGIRFSRVREAAETVA